MATFQKPPTEPADNATLAQLDTYINLCRNLITTNKVHPVPAKGMLRAISLKNKLTQTTAK